MFHVDSHFAIGSTHRVCEDYATHGLKKAPHAVIADGCSSAIDTDIGARILAKAAQQSLPDHFPEMDGFVYTILGQAIMAARAMNLSEEALYATLGTLAVNYDQYFQAYLFGDGVIAGRTGNELHFNHIEFPHGAPFYLRYESDIELKRGYIQEFGGTYKVTTYGCKKPGKWIRENVEEHEFQEHYYPVQIEEFTIDCYDFVAIMSDGVDSVQRKVETSTSRTTEKVPITEVVENLLNFKPVSKPNFTGSFVQRRFNRVFRDHPEWQHLDDISLAVIAKGEFDENENKKTKAT